MELQFGARPDYDDMLDKFESLLKELHIQDDGVYDWIIQKNNLLIRREQRE